MANLPQLEAGLDYSNGIISQQYQLEKIKINNALEFTQNDILSVFVNKKTTKYSVITGEKAKIPQGKCPVG